MDVEAIKREFPQVWALALNTCRDKHDAVLMIRRCIKIICG